MSEKNLLEIKDLHVNVEDKEILHGVNLEVGKESMVLIKENLTDDESAGIRLDVKYFDENNNELLQ